ncbi:MAG: hypothetical protein AB7T06_11175 [Kofleriaceae bacterium]
MRPSIVIALLLWCTAIPVAHAQLGPEAEVAVQRALLDVAREADELQTYLAWSRDAAAAVEQGREPPPFPATLTGIEDIEVDGHLAFEGILTRLNKLEEAVHAIDTSVFSGPTHPVADLAGDEEVRRRALHDAVEAARSGTERIEDMHTAAESLAALADRLERLHAAARALANAFAATPGLLPQLQEVLTGAWVDLELVVAPRLADVRDVVRDKRRALETSHRIGATELATMVANLRELLAREDEDLRTKEAALAQTGTARRAELEREQRQLVSKAKDIKARRKQLARMKRALDARSYDLCPNHHPWDRCSHQDLKSRWQASMRAQEKLIKREKKEAKREAKQIKARRAANKKALARLDAEQGQQQQQRARLVALREANAADRRAL